MGSSIRERLRSRYNAPLISPGETLIKQAAGSTVLIILDGWGIRPELEHNAIQAAHTPCWDRLWAQAPHALLQASGSAVGLPRGQMGNSEVGHQTLGTGRQSPQALSRINQIIDAGALAQHTQALNFAQLKARHKTLHLMGLLSPGGVHSHEDHFLALMELAAEHTIELCLHVFLDGRDCPPKSALDSLHRLEAACQRLGIGRIVSLSGRYYAMDRDQNWQRTQKAYRVLTQAAAGPELDAVSYVEACYLQGLSDEFIPPQRLNNTRQSFLRPGDSVVFMNFRADRALQLSAALALTKFEPFERPNFCPIELFSLTPYGASLERPSLFPKPVLTSCLSECLSNAGLKQLKLAETEKYAHVTYFFNAGRTQPFPLENFKLIPSPSVKTFDLQPAMSAHALCDEVCQALDSSSHDCIVVNFANADMVGHTGSWPATIAAIETLDACLSKIVACITDSPHAVFITADHGNAESMFDDNQQQAHTAHTLSPVPFVYLGPKRPIEHLTQGSLADVAPTLLTYLGLAIPAEMTGRSLMKWA